MKTAGSKCGAVAVLAGATILAFGPGFALLSFFHGLLPEWHSPPDARCSLTGICHFDNFLFFIQGTAVCILAAAVLLLYTDLVFPLSVRALTMAMQLWPLEVLTLATQTSNASQHHRLRSLLLLGATTPLILLAAVFAVSDTQSLFSIVQAIGATTFAILLTVLVFYKVRIEFVRSKCSKAS